MRPAAYVVLLGAWSCLVLAGVFAVVWVKVGRRPADALFAAVSLALAVMLAGEHVALVSVEPTWRLLGLRLQHAAAFVAAFVLFHFVSLCAHRPLAPGWLTAGYLAAATAAILVLSADSYLHLPRDATNGGSFVVSTRGPLFPLVALPVLLGATAWGVLACSLRGARTPNPVPCPEALAPLAEQMPLVVVAGALVLLGGAVVTLNLLFFPQVDLRLAPHALGTVLFCALIALALGRSVLHAELERRRLAHLVEFRNQAVRDVAHELKNPLGGIQTAVETLRLIVDPALDDPRGTELLALCADTCRRLTRLLNNMLDTARLEAGREVDLRRQPTDLPEVVRGVLATQQLTSPQHRLLLENDLSDPVASVDPDKLFQVLTNLVGNAVKYSPDGGEVSVRLWREAGELRVSVRDDGLGLSLDDQARIFERYERAVDPARRLTGTCIGLHLVRRLLEAHGGWIRVESILGEGSVFMFGLPDEPGRGESARGMG